MARLLWLADVLRAEGLQVKEVDGWKSRGVDTMNPRGVGCHHTAGPPTGDYPSLATVRDGRGGPNPVPGPLSQLGLGRSGLWYVIASGKANHAGVGEWRGIATSTAWIGVEAEHVGRTGVPWPAAQIASYERGCAALLRHLGRDASWLWLHKEYARPLGRKIDPIDFDGDAMRVRVQRLIDGPPEDDMPLTDADIDRIAAKVAAAISPAFELRDRVWWAPTLAAVQQSADPAKTARNAAALLEEAKQR